VAGAGTDRTRDRRRRVSDSGAVIVRYWAAARAAAGCAEEQVPAGTLAEIVAVCGARHGGRLPAVLGYCSFLVDGARVDARGDAGTIPVPPGSAVEVLPPFAGGC
jgi:molybdopterin synthase sulfur carrier subunit